MKKSRGAIIVTLILMMFSMCTIYYLPYLQYYYWTPLQEFFGLADDAAAYGKLLNIYGVANLILYLPGGWICDRFDAKGLMVFSMIGTGVLGVMEAFMHSYSMLVIIYIMFAVTTVLTYWSASVKVINMVSDAASQGGNFGILESGRGIVALVCNTIFVAVFTLTQSMTGVLIGSGAIMIVIGLALLFLLPKTNSAGSSNASIGESLKAYGKAFTNPSTYLLAGMIFTGSLCLGSKSFFAPYLENTFGMSTTITTAYTQYAGTVCQIVGAGIAAALATKMGRSSKPIMYAGVVLIIGFGCLIVFPEAAGLAIPLMCLMIVATMGLYVFRGLYYATVDESGTPKNTVGSVIAIASLLGFLPDTFWTSTMGAWINVDGYTKTVATKIYGCCIAAAVLGLVCAFIMDKRIQKYRASQAAEKAE